MTLGTTIAKLEPGDRFVYKDNEFLLIDFKVSDCFISAAMPNIFCALDMQTFKVVCFDASWEVRLLET